MNQGLIGHLGQEGSYHVSVGDVTELVALPGEAPDVPMEGFIGLLAAVLEVPWVSRAFVRALEVPHKDLPQVHPTLMEGAPTTLVPNQLRTVEGCR